MTCSTPARFAASAMFFAWAISFSGEKCSQKLVTRKAPQAPLKARSRASGASMSALTTSTPPSASARAASESGLRVRPRAVKSPLPSAWIARARPPPWAPVAPTMAMVFVSLMS